MTATSTSKKAQTSTTASGDTKRKVRSSIGAPSQRNQASRKGKKAWRKNVDIDVVEEGLEEIREEERVVGYALHVSPIWEKTQHGLSFRTAVQKQTNDQLFFVDQKGDEQGMC